MDDFDAPSVVPPARGPWSDLVIGTLLDRATPGIQPAAPADPLSDDDLQLALFLSYELVYRGVNGVDDRKEWDLRLLSIRQEMETMFESALLAEVDRSSCQSHEVAECIRALDTPVSPLARFIQRDATIGQIREFVIHRASYHLKEADPHTFALPRVTGAAKAAFAEIQADEYGGGRPPRIHARLFARLMADLDLDTRNGAYTAIIPGSTLALVNIMSLFGLHRRWRGAAVGHLALFELGSSRPNRLYGDGLRRLGFGPPTTDFHDEHVEADAVHSMLATYDLAARLARDEPDLTDDILFGADALSHLENTASHHLLSAWEKGASSLLEIPA